MSVKRIVGSLGCGFKKAGRNEKRTAFRLSFELSIRLKTGNHNPESTTSAKGAAGGLFRHQEPRHHRVANLGETVTSKRAAPLLSGLPCEMLVL
jgi:hypothetical protein